MNGNLTFRDLNAGNWEEYAGQVTESESVYPEALRTSGQDYAEIVSSSGALSKVALLDSMYIGNAVGFRLAPGELQEYGVTDLPQDATVLYIINIVVNPAYQGRGYGHRMLRELLRSAKERGFSFIACHCRQASSLSLMRQLGAQERGIFSNWEGSGEDFVFCLLDLGNQQVAAFLTEGAAGQSPASSSQGGPGESHAQLSESAGAAGEHSVSSSQPGPGPAQPQVSESAGAASVQSPTESKG